MSTDVECWSRPSRLNKIGHWNFFEVWGCGTSSIQFKINKNQGVVSLIEKLIDLSELWEEEEEEDDDEEEEEVIWKFEEDIELWLLNFAGFLMNSFCINSLWYEFIVLVLKK